MIYLNYKSNKYKKSNIKLKFELIIGLIALYTNCLRTRLAKHRTIMPCVLMNAAGSGNAIQRCGTAEELVRIGFPGNAQGNAKPLYLSPTDTLKMLFVTKDSHMYGLLIVFFCFVLLAWYVLRLRKELKEQTELTSRLSQRLDIYFTGPPAPTLSSIEDALYLEDNQDPCAEDSDILPIDDVSLTSRIHSAAQKRQSDFRNRGLPKKN